MGRCFTKPTALPVMARMREEAVPWAKSLKVPQPDLTRVYIRNGGTFPLKRIARIISGEEQFPSGHGTREMPVWGPFFSRVDNDEDLGPMRIDALARYLEQIQRK